MDWALGEVRDSKAHITRLEVSPTRRRSLLEGLRINFQISNHLEPVAKELWRTAACFGMEMSLRLSAYSQWFNVSFQLNL